MRALIVEDIATSRLILEAALKKIGYEVIAAANGDEAWELLQHERVDLVISDWMMPKVDGAELCRRIRSDPRTRGTYVLLVTALAGQGRYQQALDAGADDCIRRPFDPDELHLHLRLAERIIRLERDLRTLQIQAVRD